MVMPKRAASSARLLPYFSCSSSASRMSPPPRSTKVSIASSSASAAKRRVDRLRASGALRGFTAIVDHEALGAGTEALVELFYAPGTLLDEVADSLRRRPEVVEAWSVTG